MTCVSKISKRKIVFFFLKTRSFFWILFPKCKSDRRLLIAPRFSTGVLTKSLYGWVVRFINFIGVSQMIINIVVCLCVCARMCVCVCFQSWFQSPSVIERFVHRRPPVANIQRTAQHGRLRSRFGGRTGPSGPTGRFPGADRPPFATAAAARKLQGRVFGQSSTPTTVQQPIGSVVFHSRLPRVFVLQSEPAGEQHLH